MVLEFISEIRGIYEDESESVCTTQTMIFETDSIESACKQAAEGWDWNDEEALNFEAVSELIETTRDLTQIKELADSSEVMLDSKWIKFYEMKLSEAMEEG